MAAEDGSMRHPRESATATLWQLEVFVAAVELQDWVLVEQRLGVDRYRCRKAVDRLAAGLGVDKLLPRLGDRFVITDRERNLARDARQLLDSYENIRTDAGSSERSVVIRFAAYPAQLKLFAAQAVGEFEASNRNVRIELNDLEGRRRRGGGVRSTTQIRDRELDMVIAACDFGEATPSGMNAADLYGWRLIAAARDGDPTQRSAVAVSRRERLLDVKDLAGRKLLVAPKGHRSRDMLDLFGEQDPPWEIVAESENPEVLISLATFSDKVAVVPSDSVPSLNGSWPTLVAKDHGALGGKYRVLWRDSPADPARLRTLTCALAGDLVRLSKQLREESVGGLSPTETERSRRRSGVQEHPKPAGDQ